MLEINARPGRDLRALIERIGETRVCRELNVHRTTVRRWLAGKVAIPGHQHQVIRMLLGDLPGTCGKWTGWRFHDGELVAPGGDSFRAGDVLSLIILRQQLTAQRRELDALKVRLAIAEEAERRHTGAANEDLRVRA
jgi:transposase-like protein